MKQQDNILIEELREGFKKYLEVEYTHLKDKNVVLSDVFYLHRHNIGIGFWDALRNENTIVTCREKLEDYFTRVRHVKTPKSNSYSYIGSIKILKEYIDKTYGGIYEDI